MTGPARYVRLMADMRNDVCRSVTLHREKRKCDGFVIVALSR
jgi:hypothetical protein